MRAASSPEQVPEVFAERSAEGELEPVLDMYDEHAVLMLEPGEPLTGDALRSAMVEHLAIRPQITPNLRRTLASGDIALLIVDWRLEGAEPDGTPVELAGTATDVVRRGLDGQWRYLLDNPFGVAAGPA